MKGTIMGWGGLPAQMDCARAQKTLRICFVYNRLPFPMMRGDQLTVAHLLAFLKERGHEVDFFSLNVDGEFSERQCQWLKDACREVHIYPHGFVDFASGAVRALAGRLPLQVALYGNAKLTSDVRAGIELGRYDIVYVYYLRSAPVVPTGFGPGRRTFKRGKPTAAFLAMQLSQALNMQRIFREEHNVLKRMLWGFEAKRLKRYEASVWQNYSRVVLIGPSDVAAVKSFCREKQGPEVDNWVYGPHGTDTRNIMPAVAADIVPNRVLFSGCMAFAPNIQGAEWFLERCWPVVRARVPDAEFVIQGRDPPARLLKLNGRDGISVTGRVPEVAPLIRSAAVCIAPIRAAGGMQNKLVEYAACGKAIVATSIANEGIMAPNDVLVTADEPDTFAAAVVGLLQNSIHAAALGAKARTFALDHWSWEAHFLHLEREMYAALDPSVVPFAAKRMLQLSN